MTLLLSLTVSSELRNSVLSAWCTAALYDSGSDKDSGRRCCIFTFSFYIFFVAKSTAQVFGFLTAHRSIIDHLLLSKYCRNLTKGVTRGSEGSRGGWGGVQVYRQGLEYRANVLRLRTLDPAVSRIVCQTCIEYTISGRKNSKKILTKGLNPSIPTLYPLPCALDHGTTHQFSPTLSVSCYCRALRLSLAGPVFYIVAPSSYWPFSASCAI